MKELELKKPIIAHGETLSVLEFDEPTGKDVRELGQRSKLTNQLVQTVRGYIRECLQWMIDDGVVSRIDLDIRRTGINELGNSITLWRRDGPVMISFDDLWSAITHGGQ